MKRAIYIGWALLLLGCSAATPERYRLQPSIEPARCRGSSTMAISLPQAAAGLDSARIAVIDRPQHLSFYRDVAWGDTLPSLLQQYFADAFEQSRQFGAVTLAGDNAPATLQLAIALRNFEVDQSANGRVLQIRMSAQLQTGGSHRVIKRIPLTTQVDVADASIDGIVQQFNRQLDGLTQQMLRQIGCR